MGYVLLNPFKINQYLTIFYLFKFLSIKLIIKVYLSFLINKLLKFVKNRNMLEFVIPCDFKHTVIYKL